MPAKAKVASWLEAADEGSGSGSGSVSGSEAGSSSDGESSQAGSVRNGGKANGNGNGNGRFSVDDEDDDEEDVEATRSWEDRLVALGRTLSGRSEPAKQHALSEDWRVTPEHPPQEILRPLAEAVITALPRAQDRATLQALDQVLVQIVTRDPGETEGILQAVSDELEHLSDAKRTVAGFAILPFYVTAIALLEHILPAPSNSGIASDTSLTAFLSRTAIAYGATLSHAPSGAAKRKIGGIAGSRKWVVARTEAFVRGLDGERVQTLVKHAQGPDGWKVLPFLGQVGKQAKLEQRTKDILIKSFSESVVSSKESLPAAYHTAIDGILADASAEDAEKLLATCEKALMKSPEAGVPVTRHLLRVLPGDLSAPANKHISPQVNSLAKSSSAPNRALSLDLWKSLLAACPAEDVRKTIVQDVLANLAKGKTTGADHKTTLVKMLSDVPRSDAASPEIVSTLAPLIAKETSEPPMRIMAQALAQHLAFSLQTGHAAPAKSVLQALAKDMANTKTLVRSQFADAVASALWTAGRASEGWSAEAKELAESTVPALLGYLKATSTTTTPAGASGNVIGALTEGYVATALCLAFLSASGSEKTQAALGKDAVLAAVGQLSPKPSFLLSERLQRRVVQEDSSPEVAARARLWLLRALDALLERQGKGLGPQERLAALGPILDMAIGHPHGSTRSEARTILQSFARRQPKLAASAIAEAFKVWVTTRALDADVADQERHVPFGRAAAQVLGAVIVGLKGDSSKSGKTAALAEQFVVDVLIPCHARVIAQSQTHCWVDLALGAGLDPGAIAAHHSKAIMTAILDSLPPASAQQPITLAAYAAISTLAFVAPAAYVPLAVDQAAHDLDPANLATIDDAARGIWNTPEGTAFVDVLALKKEDVAENKNSKDYAQAKWDAELKKSIEAKRAAATKSGLSKADQALVDAQLAKENKIRTQLKATQAVMLRGLGIVEALVLARSEVVVVRTGALLDLLLGCPFSTGTFLVGQRAFEVYLTLSSVCSDRLGQIRPFIGIALLRLLSVDAIPEQYTVEKTADLVTRVLHRCLGLSNQTPLDAPTFAYLLPLMSHVIALGAKSRQSRDDDLQEQLTLVVEILSANSSQASQATFPRIRVINDLLALARSQPGLAKSAMSALVEISAAIGDTASPDEISALLAGLLATESQIRSGVLQALQPLDLTELDYSNELFMIRFDDEQPLARMADHIWEDNGLDITASFLQELLPFLSSNEGNIRLYAGRAIAEGASQHLDKIHDILDGLRDLYHEKAKIRSPEFDQYGMVIPESLDDTDPFPARSAIASCLTCLAPYLQAEQLDLVFDFLVKQEALGDRAAEVRSKLLETGTVLIDMHGEKSLASLMALFEDCLGRQATSGAAGDLVKEAVIILFGRLSKHLDKEDERLPRVVDRLVDALATPSEIVQSAVGDCLPPLVRMLPTKQSSTVDRLMDSLLNGSKYAIRRGAAFGLAGSVKGCGLSSLNEYEIIDRLQEAAGDKKNYQSRQGAVFAFETLSSTLGRAFEPYIISIIPLLLTLMGDANADVREATADAAKAIMATISGYCVKQILPLLLSGLEEKQWRTKKGSIELLGAMAFCAPKQLSMSLPTIIPQLTSTLTDSHAQVRTAANSSLKRFGEVLSNPEIKRLQPILLKALIDPSSKTNAALTALLATSFEHYLDSPSLALVIPILDRGLKDRGSDMKKRSVQIVGNMASLTESKDFVPYLDQLMPLVQQVLVDPVPEARATAAKALGTLVERLGEDNFPSLVTRLLETLRSDTSGVDRQGAAQGLSEVLAGLGMERMEGLLPDVVTYASSSKPYVREGFISLLVYLPATFGQRFAPHLGRIIPPILGGLADESEYVREASMRAGKMIIVNYSAKAIDLLLPELEQGMLDSQWRIRQSSIALTGELLYRVAGISGKVEIEEDDAPAQHLDSARKALTEALGQEGRDRVLATLYIVRQDSVSIVRQSSIHIWKALVHNTPKTTREILPMLISMILSLLGSPVHEQREVASRTLGELCRKNGERILAEVIPILSKGVASPDTATREGACLAFSEIMDSAAEEHIELHEDAIIAAVRTALVDDSGSVRIAAAKTFDSMMQHIGSKAIDQTIPTLLEAMRTPGAASDTALMALREVMSVRAASVFPTLLPTLTVMPISAFNARALASLVTVAGSALSKRLTTVMTPLVRSMETETAEDVRIEVDAALRALLASIEDGEGLHSLMMTLIGWSKEHDAKRRATACTIFAAFCEESDMDASDYRVDWVRQLVTLMDDRAEDVVEAAWTAFDTLIKTVPKEDLEDLVVPLRRSIESTGAPGRTVPGFCRPKGVQPIIPILLAGLLSGTEEQREQAAFGIGDIVQRTTEAAIKPYIIQLTGPLIRVISSQAIAAQIKGAILSTLTVLLEEVPLLVRPFHPQLTRTFVKSTSDPASLAVRNRAVTGLGELMKHQPRVDPLVTELVTALKAAESDIAPSIGEALAAVCRTAGKNIGTAAKQSILDVCNDAFTSKHNEPYSAAIAKMVASLSLHDTEAVEPIVQDRVVEAAEPSALRSQFLLQILTINPSLIKTLNIQNECSRAIQQAIALDQLAISRPARDAKALLQELNDD